MTRQSVIQTIVDAIENSKQSGRFSSSGVIAADDVAIKIDGFGPVKLPMRPVTKDIGASPYAKNANAGVESFRSC